MRPHSRNCYLLYTTEPIPKFSDSTRFMKIVYFLFYYSFEGMHLFWELPVCFLILQLVIMVVFFLNVLGIDVVNNNYLSLNTFFFFVQF